MTVEFVKEKADYLLGEAARMKVVEAGESLFWQGDTPSAVYQVRDGFMKLTFATAGGRESISELLVPGDIFDLPSFLDGSPYPFACKAPATRSARVAVLPRAQYIEAPEIGARCETRMLSQLQRQRSAQFANPTDRVEIRLARAFLYLAQALGEARSPAVELELGLTRQEMAEWVVSTPETIIRLCCDWKRRSWINWKRRSIMLANFDSLESLSKSL
eukprot:TRINITY_DN32141_c0_g1_i1.p1 TRINITY_DN32141_c0_g1~~TRINITY_DN32141_c0_g1_i1.p1  ORF type:complete len:217 (-),score=16.44 TRINITY_DN32141_c0_g1_i1:330-980(-)